MTFSPNLGRWLEPDPLGLTPDTDMYRYVGDNPTNLTDPSGLVKYSDEELERKYQIDLTTFTKAPLNGKS